jgi:hypothetical protein
MLSWAELTFKQAGWMTADGTLSYRAGSIGDPIFPYDQLNSLPRDPAQLNAYFVRLDPVKTDNNSVVEFSQIESMLFGMVLPPWLEAELFQALALIPAIQVKDHVKDIAGRAGVSFVLPPTKQREQLKSSWTAPITTCWPGDPGTTQVYPRPTARRRS